MFKQILKKEERQAMENAPGMKLNSAGNAGDIQAWQYEDAVRQSMTKSIG